MMRWVIISVMVVILSVSVSAQENNPFTPYEGIPFSRTDDGGFVLGDPDAPITMVEFADFMCPHCQDYHSTVEQFIAQYVKTGLARFEYRLYPIVHPTYSVFTAQLAECVEEQLDGGFWPARNVLYGLAANGQIGPNTPETLGAVLGISGEKLQTCAASAVQYETDLTLGESMDVSGTPAVLFRNAAGELGWAYINNQAVTRGGLPFATLEALVTAENSESLIVIPQPLFAPLTNLEGCIAPCWHDIIPGETVFTTVGDVLRSDRQFYEINEQLEPADAQALSWQSIGSGISEPNFILADAEGIVEIISILEVSPLTLGDVFEARGEPDYALAIRNNNGGVILYSFFSSNATIVLSFIDPTSGLTADSSVFGAQLFSQTRMKELLTSTAPADWTGFQGLESYFNQ